jgi:hypothetical protein
MCVKDWKQIKVNLAKVEENVLQEHINALDDAIMFLNNHHYGTSKLIVSTQKLLGTYREKNK